MWKPRSDTLSFCRCFRTSGIADKTALILSAWFGTGLFPIASGTFGTLGALPFAVWIQHRGPAAKFSVLLGGVAVAMWVAHRAAGCLGRKDPSEVVIDEVVGFWIAAAFLPGTWGALALGFLLFRLFDIWKPFPARQMERLPGGVGIVMDDVVAGLYALAGVRLVWMFC